MRSLRSSVVSKDAAQILLRIVSFPLIVAGIVALAAAPAKAHDYTQGALKIDHPYARPTPPGARTGGVYFTVRNTGTAPDRLVSVGTTASQSAEIHTMTMEGNLMKMRQISGLDIPPGGEVKLESGGYHVMLVGLSHPLAAGDKVPLTLTFEKAGPVQVFAFVEAPSAATPHKH